MKRLRKLFMVIVVLGLVTGGLLAFAVYNANALVQSYKPELEQKLSETLGSTVTLGAIGVAIIPSTRLRVDEVTIVSDPDSDERLTLANAALHLKLLPLLRRRLEITSLSLVNPAITIIQDGDEIYIAGLPRSTSEKDAPEKEEVSASKEDAPKKEEVSSAEVPIDLALDAFQLRGGSIVFRDLTTGTEYTITDLDVDASMTLEDDRLVLPTMKGSGTALEKSKVKFNGKDIQYEIEGGVVRIGKLDATSDGNTITLAGVLDADDPDQSIELTSKGVDLARLEPWFDAFAPDLNGLELEGVATPKISISPNKDGDFAADGTIGLAKASALLVDNRITDLEGSFDLDATAERQRLSGKGFAARYGDAPLTVDMELVVAEGKATLDPVHLEGFGGAADATGSIALEGDLPFASTYALSGMQVGELISAFLPDVPLQLTGVLRSFTAKIDGDMGETFTATITGDGASALNDGLLKDVNLAEKVLSAVDGVPFLQGALVSLVPEEWQGYLDKKYTVIESLTGSFTVANEMVSTQDFYLVSDFFELSAKGTLGFDTAVDLDSTIFFSEEFSAGLIAKSKELSVLLNDKGQLAFPVRITGQAPDLAVYPDVKNLLSDTVKGTLVDKATEALQDLIAPKEEAEEEKKKPLERLRDRFRTRGVEP